MTAGGRTHDGRQGSGDDNVVRFPRDWFGPTEALVPFGPGTEREERRAAPAADLPDGHAVSEPGQAVDGEFAMLSADDFWGEDSGSLHQVVELPRDELPDRTVAERDMAGVASSAAAPLARSHFRVPRWSLARVPAMRLPRVPRFGLGTALAAGVVLLLVVIGGIGETLGAANGGGRTGPAAASQTAGATRAHVTQRGAAPQQEVATVIDAAVGTVKRQVLTVAHRMSQLKAPVRHRADRVRRRHPTHRATSAHHPAAGQASQQTASTATSEPMLTPAPAESGVSGVATGGSVPSSEGSSSAYSPSLSSPTVASSAASSSGGAEPAGPVGTGGGAVGNDCNPKCH